MQVAQGQVLVRVSVLVQAALGPTSTSSQDEVAMRAHMCLCTLVNRQVGIQKTPSLHVAMEMQCNRGSRPVWMWVGGWVCGRVCSVFVVLVSCIVCLCTRHWVLHQPYQVKFNRKDRGV